MQTVGALSWTGGVWRDAPGHHQPSPSPGLALLTSSFFRDEPPWRWGWGGVHFWGPPPTLGERVLLLDGNKRQLSYLLVNDPSSCSSSRLLLPLGQRKGFSQHCRRIMYRCVGGHLSFLLPPLLRACALTRVCAHSHTDTRVCVCAQPGLESDPLPEPPSLPLAHWAAPKS